MVFNRKTNSYLQEHREDQEDHGDQLDPENQGKKEWS